LADKDLIVENPVRRDRSELKGFTSKDEERFWSTEVLEYWSVGNNQNPNFTLMQSSSLLHYSTTPAYSLKR
jgi:hypothetical protein